MKVALCFLISYHHVVHKEAIWKKWIEPNKDIVQVYFHYTDKKKIKSEWILRHCIPQEKIAKTSYYHVVDAYLAVSSYAYHHDKDNTWFCFLTESCVPLVSPEVFRMRFFQQHSRTLLSWTKAWWSPQIQTRANLKHLPYKYHLANAPWFVMTRNHVELFVLFSKTQYNLYSLVCQGGVANESVFAILFAFYNRLDPANADSVVNAETTLANWENMSSPTSPYVFEKGDAYETRFIEDRRNKHPHLLFLRKIDPAFPDALLQSWYRTELTWRERVRLWMSEWYYQHKMEKRWILFFLWVCGFGWFYTTRYA